jgi:hypothetical protein
MTTTREQVIQEIEQIPEPLLEEVFSFLQVAKAKHEQKKSDSNGIPSTDPLNQLIPDPNGIPSTDPIKKLIPGESLFKLAEDFVRDLPEQELPEPDGIERLLKFVEEIEATITPEELAQLPTDGAEQHDHYIYGTPKIT